MKKTIICLLLAALTVLSLSACSQTAASKASTGGSNTVSDILAQGTSSEATEKSGGSAASGTSQAPSTDVDVDLTAMSSTMVYSEVLNMLMVPDDYKGKSVRMEGEFAAVEDNGRMYYACIIRDATQCCANGIEFLWEGEHSYPEDYPELGTTITVVGEFDSYFEGEQQYIQLIDAELTF